ncbi:ATP-dependent helicase [Aeromicrobium duanguangcaii]|uniref:DNA 3'-5' helicase n=1 Tax=Aeromicrobium duanguangcaii TaxID=2968086 RepID=A0ABY5KDJ8_9ACTN|nr:ATP-dependent DNA helicase [Aeromicrobium duanguangcaii]MCD9154738.1 ATP-dependent helicase [Aeromicrobium duanguangcaii]UUI67848.1 ATP-dependent helicase [Aeromicrobium duanguangcaii]
MPVDFVLKRPEGVRADPPRLDEAQQSVVDHRGGPLLVLAGPGTGKTTTLVEVVVDRIESGELTPDQILVLTFSRKAAGELRDRIGRRLPGTSGTVAAMTFHAFCYALVREFSDPEAFAAPPELMTAPARDAVVADLLGGHDASSWPASLREALGTRGLAAELQSFMSAAVTRGLDPDDLRALAATRERPEWARVADAIEEYHQVIDLQNRTDYTDLVTRAAAIASDRDHQRVLRDRFRLVVVDEYQDTDPLQVRLLHDLAGDGRDLVVVGDHDQAIYGFRGADPGAITRFPEQFSTAGRPAPTVALTTTRRFGPRILEAARVALGHPPIPPGLDARAAERHRNLQSVAPEPGRVEVATYASATAEAEHIAATLRRAHLDDGLAWSDMAVLVRTGADLTRLQRVLGPAGVPVEVAGDEVPLVAEPAVRSLLLALEAADRIAREEALDAEMAEALLTGPLAGLDGPAMRRLGRALRRRDPETPSSDLVAASLHDPAALGLSTTDRSTADAVEAARNLAALLGRAAAILRRGEPPEQALWLLWDGTRWPTRLREQWGTVEGRAHADRDLDAVCALFRHAARAEEGGRRRDTVNFVAELRAQQIPADQLESSAARPDAVRLMTAHRSKGLEWPLVVVAGVQAQRWPDLRSRGSLLRSEHLDGPVAPGSRGEQLREERRLFYVACTRATRRLVVTAVQTPTDDGDQPSRFVSELLTAGFGDAEALPLGRPVRPVSLRGVVAELRRIGEQTDDPVVRDETAAMLAEIVRADLALTRPADPDRWWGLAETSRSETPWRPEDQPLALSGSAVEGITACSLRWFLGREAHGESASTSAQGFGSIVHALAADVVQRGVEPDEVAMAARLDEVWHRLDHQAAWLGERERQAAHETLVRFARWHRANPRTALAAEHAFTATVVVGGEEVLLRGSMDRVEIDSQGRVHVVDFKTSRNAPAPRKIAEHAQLGIYQVAVEHGAVESLGITDARSGGAELVQLRTPAGAKDPDSPKVQPQAAPSESGDQPFFALDLLTQSARTVRDEQLVARPNDHCGFCDFQPLCPVFTGPTIGGPQ